jgi:hypothetical protein
MENICMLCDSKTFRMRKVRGHWGGGLLTLSLIISEELFSRKMDW